MALGEANLKEECIDGGRRRGARRFGGGRSGRPEARTSLALCAFVPYVVEPPLSLPWWTPHFLAA